MNEKYRELESCDDVLQHTPHSHTEMYRERASEQYLTDRNIVGLNGNVSCELIQTVRH